MKYKDYQRLKMLIDELIRRKIVYNQQDFCEKIQKNKSIISSFCNGNFNRPLDVNKLFDKVCQVFPFVNFGWLMYEDGNMFDEEKINGKPQAITTSEINRAFDIIEQMNRRHGDETRRFQDQIDDLIHIIKSNQITSESKKSAV